MRFLLLLLLIGTLYAANDEHGIPDWILPGILAIESHSAYDASGSISVGDIRRGAAGELGCFQITPAAFKMVARTSEQFSLCARDPAFCEEIAARYLLYLHRKYGSWVNAVMAYNAGRPGTKAGRRYLNRVYRVMGML